MTQLLRAVVRAYNAATHKADVQLVGSLPTQLTTLPVATDISPAEVVAGREGAVLLFTDDSPDDGVLVTVYGALPVSGTGARRIQDADNDTWVDVENAPDEDRIRMTVAGVLRALIQGASPQFQLTGDVDVSGRFRAGGSTLDYPTVLRTTTDQNLQVRNSLAPSGGVMLHVTNDNDTVGGPLELRGAYVTVPERLGIGGTPPDGILFYAVGPFPRFFFEETGQAADQKIWDILIDNAELRFRAVNDANTAANTALAVFRASGYTLDSLRIPINLMLASLTASFGGGVGVVGLANAGTVPSSNPSGGGVAYAEAGAFKWRESGGSITTMGYSGTYTPTLTNVANLDASTAYESQWLRIGSTVIVSGKVDVNPTANATVTELGISLPVASDFASEQDCGGVAAAVAVAGMSAGIRGDATNNRAALIFLSNNTDNQAMFFTFAYQVI